MKYLYKYAVAIVRMYIICMIASIYAHSVAILLAKDMSYAETLFYIVYFAGIIILYRWIFDEAADNSAQRGDDK